MPQDSTATKARIIDAAFREFATHGLAGARIDRIAENARANKRAIYDYFGNKEELFDITLVSVVARGAEEVPKRWEDLGEYAGLIYDYFAADPDRMRIHLWRQLERPQPLPGETDMYAHLITEMTAQHPPDSEWTAPQLFALVWALHFTWILAPAALPLTKGRISAASQAKARRAAIVDAVRHLTRDREIRDVARTAT